MFHRRTQFPVSTIVFLFLVWNCFFFSSSFSSLHSHSFGWYHTLCWAFVCCWQWWRWWWVCVVSDETTRIVTCIFCALLLKLTTTARCGMRFSIRNNAIIVRTHSVYKLIRAIIFRLYVLAFLVFLHFRQFFFYYCFCIVCFRCWFILKWRLKWIHLSTSLPKTSSGTNMLTHTPSRNQPCIHFLHFNVFHVCDNEITWLVFHMAKRWWRR